jgi:hypothetical protein
MNDASLTWKWGLQREREALENPQEGIVGAREISDEIHAAIHGQRLHQAEGGAANGTATRDGANVGHHVDLPAEVALDANAPLGDLYAEVTGTDPGMLGRAMFSWGPWGVELGPCIFAHAFSSAN